MRILVLALFLSLFVLVPAAPARHQPVLYWTMRQADVNALVRHVPQDDAVRLAQLRQTFHDFECNPPERREEHTPEGTNLFCRVPGEDPGVIVVATHYQHVGGGESAVENWSGSVMLTLLFHALMAQPRHHTYLFAAFDGENGAKAWMRSLPAAQRRDLRFMIGLDALGMGPLQFYFRPLETHMTPKEIGFVSALELAARDDGQEPPRQGLPGHWFHTDDTKQFRYHGVPSILLFSENAEHGKSFGGAEDTSAVVGGDRYYATYRLLCTFVTEMDLAEALSREDASPHDFQMR